MYLCLCWECMLVWHGMHAAREQLEEMSSRCSSSIRLAAGTHLLSNINSPVFSLFEIVFHHRGYS